MRSTRWRRTSAAPTCCFRSSGSPALRPAPAARRPFGHPEAHRHGRALARRVGDRMARRSPRARSSIPAIAARAISRSKFPSSPLEPVMSAEVWSQVYDRLAELIQAHRTTLVFVNTRRMAERLTRQIFDRLGKDHVAAHHGSLSKEQRFDSERRLQAGQAQGPGGDRLARARHRYRRGRPRLPDRLAAFDRQLPAAGRPLGPCGRRHAQGPAVPAVARRPRRMRRTHRQRQPRRARSAGDPRAAPGRACPADRRRGQRARMERGRAVRSAAASLALSRARRARTSRRSSPCWPRASAAAAAGAGR